VSAPLIFWRDGFDSGKSGAYVRAVSLNAVIPQWIAEGIQVAGIRIDPENESNVDVLIYPRSAAMGVQP
jgi:hypothetical protein